MMEPSLHHEGSSHDASDLMEYTHSHKSLKHNRENLDRKSYKIFQLQKIQNRIKLRSFRSSPFRIFSRRWVGKNKFARQKGVGKTQLGIG